ncbi:acetyl-CoA hydrolase/transferase C-terminal domain-containing protein [Halomarina litorea]|uniref:acetyl-CoA hydrolase/transferase C-terminal domain-containing protein n=1 Tax=Halomarina litorea TaxID=2961595 RepID=UPI0020C1D052|nr:acetyl-CoA hydrolase/transferase C-terminal domain-containing protein [Halomarina sp. BCD28]
MGDERLVGDLPLTDAATAAEQVPDDACLAVSGFGSVGYPKAVPLALARAAGWEGTLDGGEGDGPPATGDRDLSLTVVSGGSVGDELDTALVEAGAMARRFPYQARAASRSAANDGSVAFHDRHIAGLGDEVRFGGLADPDIAIVEAVSVGEDWLVPSTSIGHTPAFVAAADRLVVEVNRAQPLALGDLHDVYRLAPPPHREPIPLTRPGQRMGDRRVRFDPGKLVAVVETETRDSPYSFRDPSPRDEAIAANLGDFLSEEVERNPAFAEAVRLQFGVGSLGNALMGELGSVDFGDREVAYFGEVIQDGLLDLLDEGSLAAASATSLALSAEGQDRLFADVERYADDVVLRPADVSNSAELVARLGVVAVNSALEVDLYGHVNSTHVGGTHVRTGVGGSGDFNRNALVSVTALPSTAAGGDIPRIVPMAPHVDHTEHDVGVVVTEQGVADLRGRSPRERADLLVEECAHPDFRPALRSYLDRARETGGHVPHDLPSAFDWE